MSIRVSIGIFREENAMLRYLIGFFITIGLVILLIVLLFSGGSSTPTKKVPSSGKTLDSYAATDAQVRITVDGPIVANQDHHQTQVTVDRNNVVVNLVRGYDNNVVTTQSFANTQASYSAFLHSLEVLEFTIGNTSDETLKSEAGHCSSGVRYIFEIIQGGHDIERLWATSCGGPHSYNGNLTGTLNLFRRQIPVNSGLELYGDF